MSFYQMRKNAGMTQTGIARELKISVGAVSHWETGKKYPSPAHLLRLEEILGVPAGDIIRAINAAAEKRGKSE